MNNGKRIEYSDNIVGFLDVLGFSNSVRASQKDERLRSKIRDLLQELDNVVTERTGQFRENSKLPPIKIHFFSDSITISCPSVSEQSFRWVLWVICEFFVKSIAHGFFLRGALTIGQYFESENTFFGPALLKAHDIEKSIALWPRCIIDPEALNRKEICNKGSWKNKYSYILEGDDGLPYLDYLGYSFSAALPRIIMDRKLTDHEPEIEQPSDLFPGVLRLHKRIICREVKRIGRSRENKMLLLSRYYPLSLYHNYCIKRFTRGKPNFQDSDSIKVGSEALKLIRNFEKLAAKEGFETIEIENFTKEYIEALAKDRLNWQNQLIDVEQSFSEAWSNQGQS